MTEGDDLAAAQASESKCANCGRRLDPTDKFCRECGLPTMRQAQKQKQILVPPPDTGEMKRALDAAPDPQPFARTEPEPAEGKSEEATTGDVLRATNPTFAFQMAGSTLLMVGIIIVLVVVGIVFLVLAFKP